LPLFYLRDIFGSHFITVDGSNDVPPTVSDTPATATAAPDKRYRRVLLDSTVRAAL
jgi:hypothetical protein